MSENLRDRLADHLRSHAVLTGGSFTLRSGEVSSWYIDARRTTFDGQGARLVGEAVLAELPGRVTAVGGLTMGADPIAVATAVVASGMGRDLRAFSVRKAEKQHGTGGRLVGPVRRDDEVAVLEDTTTTGGAMLEAVEVARAEGLVVALALALVDRSGGRAGQVMEAAGVAYRPLFTPTDLGVE